jgi:hypothetical protein
LAQDPAAVNARGGLRNPEVAARPSARRNRRDTVAAMRARNLLFAFASLVLVAAAFANGCGSSTPPSHGTVGSACYADNRCNAGLTCVNLVCTPDTPGGMAPSDGGAGAGGAAGKDGAAGAAAGSDAGGDAAAGAGGAGASDGAAATDGATADGTHADGAAGADGGTGDATPADAGEAGVDAGVEHEGPDGALAPEEGVDAQQGSDDGASDGAADGDGGDA